MVEDALGSASIVKFNGKETEVNTTDAMAEVSASVTEKKVAIRQALEDIDDEMGVKHEKKVAAIQAAGDAKLTVDKALIKIEEKPKTEEKPKALAEKAKEAEKSKVEEKPKAQDKPKTEEKPKAEEKPKTEKLPKAAEKPKAEEPKALAESETKKKHHHHHKHHHEDKEVAIKVEEPKKSVLQA